MGLIRLLILALVVFLIYQLIRRWLDKPDSEPPVSRQAGDMVRCQHCGIFVPRDEALSANDRYYCSRAHLDADRPAAP